MNCRQLRELLAFYRVEPFGEFRDELRHGQQMAFHHNLHRDSEKTREPFKALDFMNYIDEPVEKIYTTEELEKYADSFLGSKS